MLIGMALKVIMVSMCSDLLWRSSVDIGGKLYCVFVRTDPFVSAHRRMFIEAALTHILNLIQFNDR